MSDTRLRIEGRTCAEQLIAYATAEDKFALAAFRQGFLRELVRYAQEAGAEMPVTGLRILTDVEATAFEQKRVKYGRRAGLRHIDVPIDDLAWWADNTLELQAYLRSARGQQRLKLESQGFSEEEVDEF